MFRPFCEGLLATDERLQQLVGEELLVDIVLGPRSLEFWLRAGVCLRLRVASALAHGAQELEALPNRFHGLCRVESVIPHEADEQFF
jgi:hypothetical protein